MKPVTKITVSFLVGFAAGLSILFFMDRTEPDIIEKVKVRQISGEKINHKDFKMKRNSITFITESEGKGIIETEFPKTIIPEARAWLQRNNGIQLDYTVLYHDNQFHQIYGIGYLRRFRSFAAGLGIKASKDHFGLNATIQYWF